MMQFGAVFRRFSCFPSPIPPPVLKPDIKYTGIFINNEWQKSEACGTFPTINPTNGEIIADIQKGNQEDVNRAVNAANQAFDRTAPWRLMEATQRGYLLSRLADLIQQNAGLLASMECLDNGKPYKSAYTIDLPLAVNCLRYYAGYADKNHGKVIPIDGKFMCYTRHEPVGVCGQIIPWNFPLLMMVWKIAPALAMGNTIVLKPAEQTPLTALFTAELAKEAGFPAGVLNVVPGCGDTGEMIAKHSCVDKVAFTGSTEVGLKIQQLSGCEKLKRTTLELGGKSPHIILKDACIDQAVELGHQGVFFNQGQVCCAGSRLFVEECIYDLFVEKSVERAKARVVGDPFDERTEQGPQISEEQMEQVLAYIKCGTDEGGRLAAGGCRHGDKGYFIEPTVITDLTESNILSRREVFGPVQQIYKFSDIDEAINRANTTNYGLAAGVCTNNLENMNYIVQSLRAGTVWVNCYNVIAAQAPFGGYKDSGHGRELGEYGLSQYTEVKCVIIAMNKKHS